MSTLPLLRSTFASSSRSKILRAPRIIAPKALSQVSNSPSLTRQIHSQSLFPLRTTITDHHPQRTIPVRQLSTTSSRLNANTSSSSQSQSQSEAESEPSPNSSGVTARLKLLFKKYGWYALGIYTILSTIDCSLTFIAVHTFGAEKIEPIFDSVIQFYRVKRYGEEEADNLKKIDEEKKAEELEKAKLEGAADTDKNKWFGKTFWAELALAYAIHKTLLLPVRAGLTVAWTPKIVNWLASRGWVGKGGLTRAASHAQGKVKDASERVKDRVKRN
ncbi:hypothetical protein V866_005294 [Kwoniella sp. B9012]|uniref:DUF1279 domain-containing protein n=1 Tax=Kwoniella europaea PYCC6329 TaxID=1423913 RepID=A0AAX4KL66_9TREE